MKISAEELNDAWPELPEHVRLAVVCHILERRLAARDSQIGHMAHQIELLEQAVKNPQINYNGVAVA